MMAGRWPVLLRKRPRILCELGGAARLGSTLRFREYVRWLEVSRGARRAAAETFWRGALEGVELTPFPDTRVGDEAGSGEEIVVLSPSASAELDTLARHTEVTLNTVFVAAWAMVLNTQTDTADVTFGTTVSGRTAPIPGIQTAVGLFINVVPARVTVPTHGTVADWLRGIQRIGKVCHASTST